jgi:acetoin utilization deacetylase AcuC-like enzyme
MAIAIDKLFRQGQIKKAFILDFDLHFGDGNVNILGNRADVTILNSSSQNRLDYLKEVEKALAQPMPI